MKRFVVLALILVVCVPLLADKVKIGYINSARIIQEYKGMRDLQEQYRKDVEEWERQAKAMEQEILDLQNELQTQDYLLSAEAKQRKLRQLESLRQKYQTFLEEIWGPNGKAKQRNDEITRPVVEKINRILDRIGREEGYTIILDVAAGGVVYVADGLDLTDRILDELNRDYGAPVGPVVRKKFYILRFKDTDRDARDRKIGSRLRQLLITALVNSGKFEKADPAEAVRAVSELIPGKEEDATEEEAFAVGERLDVDIIVKANVSMIAGKISVEYKVYDPMGKVVIREGTKEEMGEENIERLAEAIAQDIASAF